VTIGWMSIKTKIEIYAHRVKTIFVQILTWYEYYRLFDWFYPRLSSDIIFPDEYNL